MSANDERRFHQEWLGYVQPVGLVVAPAALVNAGVYPDVRAAARQVTLDTLAVSDDAGERTIDDFVRLARELFEWQPGDLVPADELPGVLSIPLPEYGESLRPTWAVPDPDASDKRTADAWLLLVQQLPPGTSFDEVQRESVRVGAGAPIGIWRASPQARFERLLRESGVPLGVLVNSHSLRLVYAPRGETSGHLTFRWTELITAAGRPMLAALHMLLSAERLFTVPARQRLGALVRESRRFQNEVSNDLAEQVLEALYQLVYGFQAADELRGGNLLGEALRQEPQHVYGGLLTTLLRLVFVCYAEDRGVLPQDELYQRNYGIAGLFERLREDAARFPDTMHQRYGAWGQLLALFRMLHDGARCGTFALPPRHGSLFDPDAYPFLEGRPWGTRRVLGEPVDPPRVSDGCIYAVLERLLVLDGERLSYRALDVEQIGSVYEAMMGFELVVVRGASVAVVPKTRKPGSPSHPIVNLDRLLALSGAKRKDALKEWADCELPPARAKLLAEAATLEALLAALGNKVSRFTPRPVSAGAMLLQPTEERRRSGSHYTPRSLTEPIVRTTLRPVLEALGPAPTPAQLLALRVCDPAMGSGAFLVEACRFLGDALVEAWQRHGETPELPPDEDAQLAARRLVAQRCLYGVDRNPFAVNLAKLSLWLVTLAREHPFTFVDHALRCGDSLVGFSRRQLAAFRWDDSPRLSLATEFIEQRLEEVARLRSAIELMGDTDDVRAKVRLLRDADRALEDVRLIGDALAAAFFSENKPKARERRRVEVQELVERWRGGSAARGLVEEVAFTIREGAQPVIPFHWEIEFPEVFERQLPGFDAFVGNPPFVAGKNISGGHGDAYLAWLKTMWPEARGQVDLVAFFFLRAYTLLRSGGTQGMLATNTIAQGDTRVAGLRWILQNDGHIYDATRRIPWSGAAAVTVSCIHVAKGVKSRVAHLDGKPAAAINAFLMEGHNSDQPKSLPQNAETAFSGYYHYGDGFLFDDAKPTATPTSVMDALVARDPRNAELIHPIVGAEDVLSFAPQEPRRYVIDFGDRSIEEAEQWPELLAILDAKARASRQDCKRERLRTHWWQFGEVRPGLRRRSAGMKRLLMIPLPSVHLAPVFVRGDVYIASPNVAVTREESAAYAVLQSRIHEAWARFLASSLEDRLRYTPSDCFETFPFPPLWTEYELLERIGEEYHDFRSEMMQKFGEGLTRTYNRFHDPDERDVATLHLRELHDEMDRAVLAAYDWDDLKPRCEFLLDYEDEESDAGEPGRSRQRRKPWRYRWPDDVRDEVLARLLELNRRRAAGLPDRDAQVVAATPPSGQAGFPITISTTR